MLTSKPTRRSLESHYRDIGARIESNVGSGGRWSVEVGLGETQGCIGTCDTLLEAETLCEDYRERQAEAKEMQEAYDRIPKPCRH